VIVCPLHSILGSPPEVVSVGSPVLSPQQLAALAASSPPSAVFYSVTISSVAILKDK